jgi:hypothetical protein
MAHPIPLGYKQPPDRKHEEKYTLRTVLPAEITRPNPVAIGIPWFRDFDPGFAGGRLYQRSDGTWWLPDDIRMGIRGWHEVCLKPPALTDLVTWWRRYDQLEEGACVSLAVSRLMSLRNRVGTYDFWWFYERCRWRDPWPAGTAGTHARYAGETLVAEGHKTVAWDAPRLPQGIKSFHWALSVEEIVRVLGQDPARGFVVVLNSWGERGYPHLVRMSLELLDKALWRTLAGVGDAFVVVDR